MKIIEIEQVDSTNDYCKRNDDGNDVTVIALKQSSGRGTKGRSFVSDEGGLYVTVMRHYEKFECTQAFKIMVNACVAVCKTVRSFGLKPVIRWANDVLVGGRKICGTLIENKFSGNNVSRSVVGIGLNVNNVLPPELDGIATTMQAELGRKLYIEDVKHELINNLGKNYTLNDYRGYINWFGNEVFIKTAEREYTATAVDVDADGSLICVVAGSLKKVSAAEVSLRI